MEHEFLDLQTHGPLLRFTLARPDRLNALSPSLMREIEQAARNLIDDAATRVVIISGVGKHFSAGADLKSPTSSPHDPLLQRRRDAELGGRMLQAIRDIPQVTIAAVHGAALGGGACIAAACDFRVVTSSASFGYPEVNLGMNLMWRALPHLVQLAGPARAKQLLMSGERIDGRRMLEWGLADELVEDDTLLQEAAQRLAERYAAQPPIAVQMIKRSVNAVSSALDGAIMHMDADQNLLTAFSADRTEAARAFFEKRPGDFQGN